REKIAVMPPKSYLYGVFSGPTRLRQNVLRQIADEECRPLSWETRGVWSVDDDLREYIGKGDQSDENFPWSIFWDTECVMVQIAERVDGKLQYTHRHMVVCVSVSGHPDIRT